MDWFPARLLPAASSPKAGVRVLGERGRNRCETSAAQLEFAGRSSPRTAASFRLPTKSSLPRLPNSLPAIRAISGIPAGWSRDRSCEIVYAGKPLPSYQAAYWKVRVWDRGRGRLGLGRAPSWSMGILDPGEWEGQWLGYTKPYAKRPADPKAWAQAAPSPIFRKTLEIRKPVVRATACIAGLGYYELRLDGSKVGDRVLDPIFTRYDKRVLYATYDLTARLRRASTRSASCSETDSTTPTPGTFGTSKNRPGAESRRSASNSAWITPTAPAKRSPATQPGKPRPGPCCTTASATARIMMPGSRYPDGIPRPSTIRPGRSQRAVAGPKGVLSAEAMPPNRVIETIRPVGISEPKPGVFVVYMGQSFAGWAQLRVSGPAGTKVTLRYGERIGPDGLLERLTIDTFVQQGPFQTDCYTLRGAGLEVWEPRFTYHGFRWVEITGFPGRPKLDSVQGRVVHTSFTAAGSFACSNDLLNQIQRMTLWSYRSNFVGYPTDCPHREKNGWTGDSHLAAEQAMFNFQNVASYETWMNSFKDEQRPTGELPGIIPTSGWGYAWGNGPAWDSAYLLIPWYLYEYYGDTRVLAEHFDRMKRYVDYLTKKSKDHIVDIGLGDWVPAKTETPVAVTLTGYYYVDATIVARAARSSARPPRPMPTASWPKRSARRSVTSSANPPARSPTTARPRSPAPLPGVCRPRGYAGDRGTACGQCRLLERASRHRYSGGQVPLPRRCPTMAASMWPTPSPARRPRRATARGFAAARPRLGGLGRWRLAQSHHVRRHQPVVLRGLGGDQRRSPAAGIQTRHRPALNRLAISPGPVRNTARPMVRSLSFGKSASKFALNVTVPANTTATVYLPAASAEAVIEGRKPVAQAPGVSFARRKAPWPFLTRDQAATIRCGTKEASNSH